MNSSDLLIQLAEIAVAFAGFSGVVAALGSKNVWSTVAVFRFQNLLLISIMCVFLSLLPQALSFYGLQERDVWKVASSVMLVVILIFMFQRGFKLVNLLNLEPADQLLRILGTAIYLLSVLSVTALSLGLAEYRPIEATYVSSIIVLLFVSALQFAVLTLTAIQSGRQVGQWH
tara:strand:- start:563 stop:1081 length:519 start_codon:yes stop_codon:yes gene_type:complete